MKYIQIILLFIFSLVIWAVLGILICPIFWFLGGNNSFSLADKVQEIFDEGTKKILQK